jgi:hypothetical protein
MFYKIAQFHNAIRNIPESIENLIRALETINKISHIDEMLSNISSNEHLPIVETCINICNAYLF